MIGGLIGLIVGMLGGLLGIYLISRFRAQSARSLSDQIIANANREAETTRKQAELEAKEIHLARQQQMEREADDVRKLLREQERRLEKRSDLTDQKFEMLNKKEQDLEGIQRSLATQGEKLKQDRIALDQIRSRQIELLQELGHLSLEDARTELLRRVEQDLKAEFGTLVMRHEAAIREACQHRSQEILTTSIQRYAASHTAEVTVSTVDIPSDEMKGRIIGREGRNIRAFEKATGLTSSWTTRRAWSW
jgi:ribonuclease Y